MVKIEDDFIEEIAVKDLVRLGRNDGLVVRTYNGEYHIHKDQTITLTEDEMLLNKYGEVINIKYERIKKLYKIKYPFQLEASLIIFIAGVCLCCGLVLLSCL